MKRIFAFDMGKASIGWCVREDDDIKDAGSLIIDIEHSDNKNDASRRRVSKTILAHREREKWLDSFFVKYGILPLPKDDWRFKKEFSAKDDNTVYNSTLLRIALIQGRKLEVWQIYKALHSAIQRRGYDSNVAWANNSEDEKDNKEAVENYSSFNGVELIKNDKYKYPCYYDALLQGLWNEDSPNELKRCVGLSPEKIRIQGRVAPRSLVEKELTELFKQAKKQISELKDVSPEEFLYGDYREKYGSYYNPDLIRYRGSNKDWQGVLGQKIPRFDNRIISKCKLLPKRNVCSADTIENISFTLLMKLKNLRFINSVTRETEILAPYEIKEIYENKLPSWIESLNIKRKDKTKNPTFTITKTDIENVIGKKTIKDKLEPFKANISGRSSFCRRACRIMIDIITSGDKISDIDIKKYIDDKNSPNPITEEEIREMISKVGEWDNLFVPDNREKNAELSNNPNVQSDILIGGITNPVVRNRLQIFKNLLNDLIAQNGKPDEVIFEFIRDGADNSLFGAKKAKDNEDYMKKQEKENDEIKKILDEADAYSLDNFLKYKLAKMQDFKCIYSGERIGISDFSSCEIDHIYPRTMGGCDSIYNKVICRKKENQDKKGRTPYEWLFHDKQRWAEYTERVINLKTKLGKKKAELLVLPPEKCQKLIENYNGLAETAQVARVASAITHFICGWGMQVKGQDRHVFVENGATTAKIRRMLDLNSLLGDDKKKNRNNPKHHALDAICISYSRRLFYDEKKDRCCINGIKRTYVEQKLNEIMPYPYTNKKPLKSNIRPLETIYGKRIIDGKAYITSKAPIESVKCDLKSVKNIVDKDIKADLTEKLNEKMSASEWINMLKNYIHPKKKTKVKRILMIVSEGVLELDANGRERIGEYADFGTKGTFGQFKHSKGHKGQILYYDKKGAAKVCPLYSNKSVSDAKKELVESGLKLYRGGEVFYSGCLVEVPEDFMAGANKYPKGIYKLRTIVKKGDVKLESAGGIEILTSVKNLTNAKFSKLKN